MNKYQNGKIYKLIGNNKIYIGSTINPLWKRKERHLYQFRKGLKNLTSFEILTDPNYTIELIENYLCNSKEELLKRERWYIENNECVNKLCPILTDEEKKQQKRDEKKRYYDKYPEKKIEEKNRYYQRKKQLKQIEKDLDPTKFSYANPDGLNLQQYLQHIKYLKNNISIV